MRKFISYLPALIAAVSFLPVLLVGRAAANNYITGSDLVLAAPVLLHFGLMAGMSQLARYSAGSFTGEEKRAFRLLIAGVFTMALLLWIMAVFTANLPKVVIFSSAAGLVFALYDLLMLVSRLQTARQLNRMVLLNVFVPASVALGLCYVSLAHTTSRAILNPVALFFMIRAVLTVRAANATTVV
jgi:hypothetical protein